MENAFDIIAVAIAKKYTDDSIAGGGISAGKNCVVSDISPITGGNRVTFQWTLDNGTVQTRTMDVMDGADGQDGAKGDKGDTGKGIKAVTVNEEDHLIITYTDDTTSDAGQIQITAAVDSVNGKTGEVTLDASDVGALPDDTAIPSKTSDLTNDSDFVADASYVHTDNNYDATAKAAVDALGTVSTKDSTTYVNPENTDIPTSNAVYQAMTSMLEGVFRPAGNKTVAELTSALLVQANVGKVYKITDNGTTTADWVGGAGQTITAGQMAVVVFGNEPNTFLFNLENGINIDMSAYQTKAITPITVDGHTKSNVEDAIDAINDALDDRADKVASATNGNFAGLDSNGNLTDSGKKASDFATPSDVQDVYEVMGENGAKNLLKNTATSQTINNVAFTVNSDDKTVNVTRTAEQTEIATRDLYVVSDEDYKLLAGKTLLMTGCPSGGSNDTYYLECYYNDGTGHWLRDVGEGLTITLPATKPTTIKFLIGIKVASVIPSGGLAFKPMIRLASDTDDTYQPYAMTNKELMEKVNSLPREVFVTTDTRTTTTNDANTLPCGFTRMNDLNSNLPTDGTGGNVWYDILTVRQSNDSSKPTWGYGFQLAVQTTTNANMGDMYVRAVNGGESPAWSAWKKLN